MKIEDLQAIVEEQKKTIEAQKSEIEALSNTVKTINKSIESGKTDYNNIKLSIDELKKNNGDILSAMQALQGNKPVGDKAKYAESIKKILEGLK